MSIKSLFARLNFLGNQIAARSIGDYRDDGIVEEYFKLRLRMRGF
jgi:hypothetical protein